MTPEELRQADGKLDEIAGELSDWIDSNASSKIRQLLAELSKVLPELSITLEMNVTVFNDDHLNSLPLLQTGLTSMEGKPPHQIWADSTPMRYVARGEIAICHEELGGHLKSYRAA